MCAKQDKEIKYQAGEPLYQWVDRVADLLRMNDKQRQAMKEVSKRSYIVGVRSTLSSVMVEKGTNTIHEN